MRAVIQRVERAEVTIANKERRSIGAGLLILLGITHDDTEADAEWLASKIVHLRIFNDAQGLMNLSINELDGELMVVSQFTLHAKTRKGKRPSYVRAARPSIAEPLYRYFVRKLQEKQGCAVLTGEFGAHMKVALVNDGPVTLLIDTKNKE